MKVNKKAVDYRFKYDPRALDLWRLSMYGIYSSKGGVANTIIIVVSAILTMKFWASSKLPIRVLLLLGLSSFTLIQPLSLYRRCKKQLDQLPEDMYLAFSQKGVHIEMPGKKSIIKWKNISGIKKMKSMLVLYISNNEGYLLTDRILGEDKDEFYDYLLRESKAYLRS